jgi:hypothetical protein
MAVDILPSAIKEKNIFFCHLKAELLASAVWKKTSVSSQDFHEGPTRCLDGGE